MAKYLEINKLNKEEKDELLNKVEKLVSEAVENLEGQEDYIYGGDERPNDLMDCGYADGNYDAWYEVLELLGIKHRFKDNRTNI
jgi:hypothetical protein